jgi:hypothetical protein
VSRSRSRPRPGSARACRRRRGPSRARDRQGRPAGGHDAVRGRRSRRRWRAARPHRTSRPPPSPSPPRTRPGRWWAAALDADGRPSGRWPTVPWDPRWRSPLPSLSWPAPDWWPTRHGCSNQWPQSTHACRHAIASHRRGSTRQHALGLVHFTPPSTPVERPTAAPAIRAALESPISWKNSASEQALRPDGSLCTCSHPTWQRREVIAVPARSVNPEPPSFGASEIGPGGGGEGRGAGWSQERGPGANSL